MKKFDATWLYSTPIAHRGLYDNNVFPENTAPAYEEDLWDHCFPSHFPYERSGGFPEGKRDPGSLYQYDCSGF